VTPALLRSTILLLPAKSTRALIVAAGWILVGSVTGQGSLTHLASAADVPVIQFDMPPLAVAQPHSSCDGDATEWPAAMQLLPGETMVTCELNLSSMISTPQAPQIDQWLVRCQPRDDSVRIADYQPRTEVASELEGPIQVKELDEQTESFGLSIDGAYGHLAQGNLGGDQGKKQTDSYQYNKIAPLQAVTASGTINRGRGVYFKLRWTATQVLEGEKKFTLTFRVPAHWRSGLIDVSVIAQSHRRSFASWDDGVKTIGAASFVVAAYRQGDREAAMAAQTLAEAEQNLRQIAATQDQPSTLDSFPSMLRHVVMKFDRQPPLQTAPWVDRLITGKADPYFDKQIRRLPVDVRVAALDYCDARDSFAGLQ
tara:strand:- start:2140 stop:3246 length:1107 start_codon:yes stop_codon:yes gene_type:complete